MKSFVCLAILVLSAALVSPAEVGAQGMQQNKMDQMPGMGDAKQGTTGSSTGTVTALNTADRKITFNHGPIPEIKWPAMKMEFPVARSVNLSTVKVGDKVCFTVRGQCVHGAVN